MNVLFVGNSYTFFNDMPKLFEALAIENGRNVTVDTVTKGGRKLYENLNPEDEYYQKIVGLLKEKTYDVLILQEQSYFALVDFEKFCEGLSGLMDLVRAQRTVFYATWGRKVGCPLLEELGLSSAEMTERLADAYQRAAERLGAELSPVGACFQAVAERDSSVELYNKDLSHPSLEGSTLSAMVHYTRLFGELPKSCRALNIESDVQALFLSVLADCVDFR